MVHSRLLVFDDGRGDFGPLTDLRAAFDLRTGAFTTLQRIACALARRPDALIVPHPLSEVCAEDHPGIPVNPSIDDGPWLMVNGRLAAGFEMELQGQWTRSAPAVVTGDGRLIVASADAPTVRQFIASACSWESSTHDLVAMNARLPLLLDYPWHILDTLEKSLAGDLATFKTRVAPSAVVHPSAVIDQSKGAVVVDERAIVGPLCVLQGPCYVGPDSQLQAHTYLRPHAVVGPACKVAGEISFCVMQGLTNKSHYGYLGHSLVGQWCNLGAGTTVSNLKNTYGKVRVQLHPGGESLDTGRMFQGPVIGDFVRTAIGSRLLTGSCASTGAMIALSGFAPKCAKPFGFYTDQSPDGEAVIAEKFIATVRTAAGRRNLPLGRATEARLRSLIEASRRR